MDNVETMQNIISNDEVVYGMTLKLDGISENESGKYTCVISNNYGMLSKSINVKVGKLFHFSIINPVLMFWLVQDLTNAKPINQEAEAELKSIFQKQFTVYKKLIELSNKNPETILKQLDNFQLNWSYNSSTYALEIVQA